MRAFAPLALISIVASSAAAAPVNGPRIIQSESPLSTRQMFYDVSAGSFLNPGPGGGDIQIFRGSVYDNQTLAGSGGMFDVWGSGRDLALDDWRIKDFASSGPDIFEQTLLEGVTLSVGNLSGQGSGIADADVRVSLDVEIYRDNPAELDPRLGLPFPDSLAPKAAFRINDAVINDDEVALISVLGLSQFDIVLDSDETYWIGYSVSSFEWLDGIDRGSPGEFSIGPAFSVPDPDIGDTQDLFFDEFFWDTTGLLTTDIVNGLSSELSRPPGELGSFAGAMYGAPAPGAVALMTLAGLTAGFRRRR